MYNSDMAAASLKICIPTVFLDSNPPFFWEGAGWVSGVPRESPPFIICLQSTGSGIGHFFVYKRNDVAWRPAQYDFTDKAVSLATGAIRVKFDANVGTPTKVIYDEPKGSISVEKLRKELVAIQVNQIQVVDKLVNPASTVMKDGIFYLIHYG